MDIQQQIRDLIFNNSSDKFIYDFIERKHKINPKMLSGIKEYAVIKKLVT